MRKQIRWICTNPDGSMSIVASAPLEDLAKIGITTEDQIRNLCLGKSFAGCTDIQEMPEGWTPPTDRTFRNAWRVKGKSREGVSHSESADIEVDMPTARDIHREHLRRKRIPKFEELDAEYLRALEIKDVALQDSIVADKQILRDIPADPAIDAATTPEQLKAVWPDILR